MEALLVGLICLAAIALFVSERMAPDIVALLVLCALVVLDLVKPGEAMGGFASAATITVGAMFVLAAGLRDTGALRWLAQLLAVVGTNGPLLLVATMLVAAGISAFINNTAAVAVLIPVVLAAAHRRGVSAQKLLLPLSYASQFGGVCTLIGTSTNLLVNSLAIGGGFVGFGMFDFAPVGLLLVLCGTGYMILVGWFLLPNRPVPESLEDAYALRDYVCAMAVPPDTPWVGKTLEQLNLSRYPNVALVEIIRGDSRLLPDRVTGLRALDVLVFEGGAQALLEVASREHLTLAGGDDRKPVVLEGPGLQLLEVLVPPNSRGVGRTLAQVEASWIKRASVLAIARRGDIRHEQLGTVPLRVGDALLLLVGADELAAVRDDGDFILLSARHDPLTHHRKAPLALAIVASVIAFAAAGWLPVEIAAVLGGVAMVLSQCITSDRAYRAIDLRVLVLLGAMLPLGLVLERSGAARALVDGTLRLMPQGDPIVALALIYLVTAALTEVVSNNATAVLMTPIALVLASQLGVSSAPFLVAVAFAASTSFSTPIGYQTNTMVYATGNYAFRDFLKVGMPLNLLFWVVSVWAIPHWFPF